MPLRKFIPLFIALAMCALSGCDLRTARFGFAVKDGTFIVMQTGDEITFTFVDRSGNLRAQEKRAFPYGTADKESYAIVDLDNEVLLLNRQSIINRLPKDKTDEGALLQEVLKQVTTVAYSRSRSGFVSLQTNKVRSIIPIDSQLQILSTVERIDIHETVNAQVVAVLHSFPSLVSVVIGNQRIEADAFDVEHLPASVRTLNIAPCQRILNHDSLVAELNSSGVTDLLINREQEKAFGDKLLGRSDKKFDTSR